MPPPPSGRRVGGAARRAAAVAGLVLLYYGFSIGITFYNKWLMKSFGFPLFMTLLHLLVIFALSGLARRCCCAKRPARVVLPWAGYLRQVAPAALSTALDVGLSNWSFLYITVSLYTMTKSSAVLFILLFSLAFKLEEPGLSIPLTPCSTCSQPCSWGFSLSLLHLKGLSLAASEKLFRFQQAERLLGLLGKLALGGVLAFGLGFSEFLLVSRTSSLALSVSGIFKEVCTLLLAAQLTGDRLSPWNWLGCVLCLLGISLHVALKALSARGHKGPKQHKEAGSGPDLELLLLHQHQEEAEAAGSLQP
ncbi:solute carrier family 35 member C2 isoform X7 [Hemicordylus capensis]|uniref:solute carrier family 35 member C2 isoform X7 n=1 Tax=Hemicordylus capensis TaxID=884348 RepID=UPI00230490E6|nr:solute carrier family 35 member C2 isoform X7 [Hemicordylus capensis]